MRNEKNKVRQVFKRNSVATAISSVLVLSGSVLAAENEEDAAVQNQNVVTVTANRREESIHKIPFNISAISGDTLEDAQITDASELMRNIAGVAVVDRGPRNSGVINGIMIRGLNVDGSAFGDYALSTVPTVSTYVNDTPVFANFMLKDINRVEVLRGPQGTLYGSGSLGGTVKYILNSPEIGEFSGSATAGFSSTEGSDDLSWTTDVVLNIPISDSVALRFAGGIADYAGMTDYVNVYQLDENRIPVAPDGVLADTAVYQVVKDADTADINHARLSLLIEPNDNFSALLSYQTQSDDIGGRRQQTLGSDGYGEPYEDYENGSVVLEPSSREVDLVSLEMDFDLGFATLTSSTSSYDQSGDSVSENTGFYATNGWLGAFYGNQPRPLAEAQRTYTDEALIQEVRLVSNGDEKLKYVAGIYYQDQDLSATQVSYLRGYSRWADLAFGPGVVLSDTDFDYLRVQNYKDFSIFGEVSYDFTDEFRMTFGGRRFSTEFTNDTRTMVGLFTSFNIQDEASFNEEESGSLFKVNAAYDLAEDQMLYATISEGYRRGGANAVPLVGSFAEAPEWQLFEPDTNINYEIGIKGQTGDVNYNLSAFYVDWDNIQINTSTTNWAFFAAQNGGSASTSGIEAEISGHFGDEKQWHYGIGYAYVDAKLTEELYRPDDINRTNVIVPDGARLPGTSENTVNMAVTHTKSLQNGWLWSNRFSLYYQSETENALSQSVRFQQTMDGFSILGYSSSIVTDYFTTTFWIKNLTNEQGTTGVFKEEYMGTSPAQGYFGNGSKEFLALPRTIGLTVSYVF